MTEAGIVTASVTTPGTKCRLLFPNPSWNRTCHVATTPNPPTDSVKVFQPDFQPETHEATTYYQVLGSPR